MGVRGSSKRQDNTTRIEERPLKLARPDSPPIEKLDQHYSRNEPTDMRAISDAALLGSTAEEAQAADQLEGEPDPDRHYGRYRRQHAHHDHAHSAMRKQEHVSAQDR